MGSAPITESAREAVDLLEALVATLPGGELREGQREMTRLVAEAIEAGRSIGVKASTGTGKSLAVLAAVVALGHRTVIATATKALQDQYVHKELPFVERALNEHGLPQTLHWAVLKGRSNYACRARLNEAQAMLAGEQVGPDAQEELDLTEVAPGASPAADARHGGRVNGSREADDNATLQAVFEWVESTIAGDLAELPFELDWRTAQWVSTSPEGCPGADKCGFASNCFAERATAAARDATVVLVNTALLGADLSLDSALVGDADVYVIDEAHEAEDILAAAFGAVLHPDDIERLERAVRSGVSGSDDLRRSLRRVRDRLTRALADHLGERFRDGLPPDGELADAVTEAGQLVSDVQRRAREAAKVSPTDHRAEACRRSADRLFETINRILDDGDGDAIWVDGDSSALRRVPIDVSERLTTAAWEGRSVVLTSATLPEQLNVRLGLADGAEHHDVGSPFDHREAAWLYVPPLLTHVPARVRTPQHNDWFEEAWAEAAAVIDAAEGRTLFLCTSARNTRLFAERARAELQWPVLQQGEQPKAKLLAEFSSDEHSVLFGTMGLWQGVDVPGPSLSCVIVDKIPFPRPDDPLWQARVEHAASRLVEAGTEPPDAGYRAFLQVQVPRAAALLAQGSGRLIRTATDRGLVVVLDPRLAEKSYRAAILAEMPPMRRTRSRREAIAHLLGGSAQDASVPAM